jgi:ABC transport system ATP-binding/permease protein
MNFLSAEKLSKSFSERILFRDVNIGLSKGDKLALIAANGAGKTTLLRILAGKDSPESGKIAIRNGIRLGYLEQDPMMDSQLKVSEYILSAGTYVREVINEYNSALERHSKEHTDEAALALENSIAKMDHVHAWDYDRRMTVILDRFAITNLEQTVNTLSGGQRKRLALAIVLIDEPDLLLLDEPTNHLDISMIEWLEKYLSQASKTFVMVTHDRYFLDRVCNRILELNNNNIYVHNGNYSYFLEKKSQREAATDAEIEKAGNLMKTELEWIRRMPKARTTKSKSRIDAFQDLREKATRRKTDPELKLDIKMSRMGGKILEFKGISKSYNGIRILEDFNYTFLRGERIGIIGKNGVGKSTFLNILAGTEPFDSGSLESGETIVIGYYRQEGIKLPEDKRVIDVVKDIAEFISLSNGKSLSASQFLQHFLFSREMQYSFVSKLSGGEKRRLYLLTVLIKNPNFLILDEPTNDLDIITLNVIEEFLMNFGGCLIMATHDRYFLDKLADHIFIFEGNGIISDFTGSYSEYSLESRKNEEDTHRAEKPRSIKTSDTSERSSAKSKKSYSEKLEFESLTKEIDDLETEKSNLEIILGSGENDYEKLQSITIRIGEIIALLDEKVLRWLELDEIPG